MVPIDNLSVQTFVVGDLATNCYLITDTEKNEAMVIDPGGPSDELLQEIDGLDIKYVLLTHAHADHMAWAGSLVRHTDAPLYLHEDDVSMYQDPGMNLLDMTGSGKKLPEVDVQIKDGDKIQLGQFEFCVLHTPGHTPGSITLLGPQSVFSGDTLFSSSVGRTDLPGGSNAQLQQSLQKLKSNLGQQDLIYPGHGPSTDTESELQKNPFLQQL